MPLEASGGVAAHGKANLSTRLERDTGLLERGSELFADVVQVDGDDVVFLARARRFLLLPRLINDVESLVHLNVFKGLFQEHFCRG